MSTEDEQEPTRNDEAPPPPWEAVAATLDAAEAAESDAPPDAGAVAVGIDAAEAAAAEQPEPNAVQAVETVETPSIAIAPVPEILLPPHIVGKGFTDAAGTWRVVLPSGRAVALNNDYHGVTAHEDGSISVDKLVEIGPFVGKLTRGVWRVDHPEA